MNYHRVVIVIFVLLISAIISGCASVPKKDALNLFAACAAADVVTTTIGLSTKRIVEANPITRALFIKALGPVAGYVVPVIGLSVLGYLLLLDLLDNPTITAAAAGATCYVAGKNAALIW